MDAMTEHYTPTRDEMRAHIETQTCPWCGRGPFRMLANHTRQAHSTPAAELRDIAFLTKADSLCSPETRERAREVYASMKVKPHQYATPQPGRRKRKSAREVASLEVTAAGLSALAAKWRRENPALSREAAVARGRVISARNQEKNAELIARLRALRDEGKSVEKIAAEVGRPYGTVHYMLYGRERRRAKEAAAVSSRP